MTQEAPMSREPRETRVYVGWKAAAIITAFVGTVALVAGAVVTVEIRAVS